MIKFLVIIIITGVIFILVYFASKGNTAKATIIAVLAALASSLSFAGQYIIEFVEYKNQNIESNQENQEIVDVERNAENDNEDLSRREEEREIKNSYENYESEKDNGEYAEDTAFITFIGESHEPSDVANKAEVSDWIKDEDYDLNGKTYEGGVKIVIYNMFSALDGNSSNTVTQIVSESHFAIDTDKMESLPEEYKQLAGKFVIGKDTDGSPSTATITILTDNSEEVYNSGEVNCYSLNIPSFNISLSGKKELIIKVVCQHSGNPFVIGMVSDK